MISFTDHARDKLQRELAKLGITDNSVGATIEGPDLLLFDPETDRYVAIKWSHSIAVIYEKQLDDALVITVRCSTVLKEIVDRRRSGRWI